MTALRFFVTRCLPEHAQNRLAKLCDDNDYELVQWTQDCPIPREVTFMELDKTR
jgi:hypothetical protein